MKLESTRGFHSVEGPNGNEIVVEEPFEVEESTGNYILETYPGFEIVEGGSGDENPTPEADKHPTNEDGEPLCVGKEDGQCSRVVDELGAECWQH